MIYQFIRKNKILRGEFIWQLCGKDTDCGEPVEPKEIKLREEVIRLSVN